MTDKNKAAYKLKNFGPVYYLNLDGQPERKEYMEDQFKYWEISDYTRISAYDGRDDDLSDIIQGKYPDGMTSGEIGCVTSHLKAIKYWLETSDSPYAIICEDDMSMDLVQYWTFTWSNALKMFPYDWDVVQLAIINPGQVHINLHQRFVNDFSTACYVIERHYAQKLMRCHIRGDKYKLDNGVKPRAVADDLIYNSGMTYSIPLFHYKIDLGSSIHPEHVDIFHRSSHDGILNYWKNEVNKLEDWRVLFEYDPYLGRLPPGTT
jgi:hypothetical protein